MISSKKCMCEEVATSRALDLSVPWRPLHSPYQQHQYHHQNHLPSHLISFAHFDVANKAEIVQVAQHNAQILKKYKDLGNQPITSYSNPFQLYSQTPGPISKIMSTTSVYSPQQAYIKQKHSQQLKQQLSSSASNIVQSHQPYPGKLGVQYQTKLSFQNKHEFNPSHHQNTINQISTTPKISGFTKENGKVHVHYHGHHLPQFLSTTKKIPVYRELGHSSSITPSPYGITQAHPVMKQLHAHLAIASAASHSHSHSHKLKQSNKVIEFSPPSQIISSYANFGSILDPTHYVKTNYIQHAPPQQYGYTHFNHHAQKPNFAVNDLPANYHYSTNFNVQQERPQVQPSLPASVITPFLDQVHLIQKEAASEQKPEVKPIRLEVKSPENVSFEMVNDVFSKHLVPPPPSNPTLLASNNYKPISSTVLPAEPTKYKSVSFNLSMPSPLQDASRFSYVKAGATATPSSTTTIRSYVKNLDDKFHSDGDLRFRPMKLSPYENTYLTTERVPNVFNQLNRSTENAYKQHKLLHPSYTGYPKRQKIAEKPAFLPTPYRPGNIENKENEKELSHSFFTIEDAMTQLPISLQKNKVPIDEQSEEALDIITLAPYKSFETETPITIGPTLTPTPSVELPQKNRQKLRKRRPKPQKRPELEDNQEVTTARSKSNRNRISNFNDSEKYDSESRNRIRQQPSSSRTRNQNITSIREKGKNILSESSVKINSEVDQEKNTQLFSNDDTLKLTTEIAEVVDENIKHRVRLRLKNTSNQSKSNVLETANFKPKMRDNVAEKSNLIFKQDDEGGDVTTESGVIAESSHNDIRSKVRLPNYKNNYKNEDQSATSTFFPTTTKLPPVIATTLLAVTLETEGKIGLNKPFANNRPRFSIKDYRKKQLVTGISTTPTSTTTIVTKPDGQRFNRLRFQLNKKRNETSSGEDKSSVTISSVADGPKRKFSIKSNFTTKFIVSSTTEGSPITTKKGSLPKRILPSRNFTKYNQDSGKTNVNIDDDSNSLKPVIKNTTYIAQNRPPVINLRQRITNYNNRKKESLDNISNFVDSSKNLNNLSSELLATTQYPLTSTESPTHETSIMKIAKSSSHSTQPIRTTTSNFIVDTEGSYNDLTGSPSEHSQRVAELTNRASSDQSFKSVNTGLLSRRIPSYFTISTDDPILPIQAFFPGVKTSENNNEN